jgi:hypothetical protein
MVAHRATKAEEHRSGLPGANAPLPGQSQSTGRPGGGSEQLGLFGDLPRQDAPPKPWVQPRQREPPLSPLPSSVLTGAGDTLLLRDEAGRPIGAVIRYGRRYVAHVARVGKLHGVFVTQEAAKAAVQAKIKGDREARKGARRFALYRR